MTDKNEKRILRIIRYSPSAFIFIITILVAYLINNEYEKNLEEEIKQIRSDFMQEQKQRIELATRGLEHFLKQREEQKQSELRLKLKEQVKNAHDIATSIYEKNKHTESKEQIVKHIKDVLEKIRFLDNRGYLFIYDMQGNTILNAAFPKLNNKNLWTYRDAKGTLIFQEMTKIMEKKDEAFYEWYWNQPNQENIIEQKTGYFKKFEPYNWYIGTGEYKNSFKEDFKKQTLKILQSLRFINDGYVFIFNKNADFVSTIHTQMIGQNLHDLQILKELSTQFRNFIESSDTKRFIQYKVYENKHDENPKNKISHIIKIDNLDWVVGTGFNLEDVKATMKKAEKQIENKYVKYLENLIIISVLLLIIMLFISFFISRYLEKIFNVYKSTLENKNKNLLKAQKISKFGDWKIDLNTQEVYWSSEVYKIFDVNSEKNQKITPEFIRTLIQKEDKELFDNSISQTKQYTCTYKIKTHKQEIKWVESKSQFNEYSNTVIGTVQDVTQTKLLEIENLKQEKILYQQSKMAAMGEMLNNIAHQWRQPLSTISTASTGVMLQKEMQILKDQDLINSMKSINKSAQYLSQTIDDFRNFFNPKNNIAKEVLFSDVLEKSLTLIAPQFSAKDIQIIKKFNNQKIVLLENEFIQVLINILNNSRDALIQNNKDEKRLIFIESLVENEKLILNIYDNAKGIEKAILNKVFEPYFTTKFNAEGTGIGLYMSQEIIVKLLKGKISVFNKEYEFENIKYKGACFKIELEINNDFLETK